MKASRYPWKTAGVPQGHDSGIECDEVVQSFLALYRLGVCDPCSTEECNNGSCCPAIGLLRA